MSYFEVLSEEYEMRAMTYDPPEYGKDWMVIKAATREKAKYAYFQRKEFNSFAEMPKVSIRKLDETNPLDVLKLIEGGYKSWDLLSPEVQGELLFLKDHISEISGVK